MYFPFHSVDTFWYFKVVILFFQDYILTKHANLRNYVCIGNEDNNLLDIDDMYGRRKGTFTGIEYVWFKMKHIQLMCTRNEYLSNSEVIKKHITAGSEEYNTINAESVGLQNSIFIKSYYKFMSDLNPPKKSRVVSIYYLWYLLTFYFIKYLLILTLCFLFCRISSFRSTKSTTYAIMSFIFVF